jgi:hypothetical protein
MELWKFQLIFFFHLCYLVNMDERRHKPSTSISLRKNGEKGLGTLELSHLREE